MTLQVGSKEYIVVSWPQCQYYMDDRSRIHLAVDRGWEDFGDSAYIVERSNIAEIEGDSSIGVDLQYVVVDLGSIPELVYLTPLTLYPVSDIFEFGEFPISCYFILKSELIFFERHASGFLLNKNNSRHQSI
jgi:hypothetical protein